MIEMFLSARVLKVPLLPSLFSARLWWMKEGKRRRRKSRAPHSLPLSLSLVVRGEGPEERKEQPMVARSLGRSLSTLSAYFAGCKIQRTKRALTLFLFRREAVIDFGAGEIDLHRCVRVFFPLQPVCSRSTQLRGGWMHTEEIDLSSMETPLSGPALGSE